MVSFVKLKAATSLYDVADILGFQPKSLAYILYKKLPPTKYNHFEIPKRSGGTRLISAPFPDLMNLQKRLSKLLQNCISQINEARHIKSALSHGFRPKYSIITNAVIHRNKRYVFNIDLENFFGTINFGRVRGFFITNRNFKLHPKVATILAQIACHDNALPQGSPCSPVISNLIGHLLDVRLANLANQVGCSYSRYADDLTFSTNKRNFPTKVAEPSVGGSHQWQVGQDLAAIITKAGFVVNNAKTRMQYHDSRQEVTGLVVNSKVNIRAEYKHMARAMVNRLLTTGSFHWKKSSLDRSGNLVVTESAGTIEQLNGILSFIDSVSVFNKKKDMNHMDRENPLKHSDDFDGNEKLYKRFLFFKHFLASPQPLIICEGKTDNIYIKAAIRQLAATYPQLATKNKEGGAKLNVMIFRRTQTTDRFFGLTGGTSQLVMLIREYFAELKHVSLIGKIQPILVLIDNDEGAKGIRNYVATMTKSHVDSKMPHMIVGQNFYVVQTPLTADGKDTMIEDFFDAKLLKTTLDGKTFNPVEKGFDYKTEYGKSFFATHVIKKNEDKIDFSGFKSILDRIVAVLDDHSKKHP